MHRYGQFCPIAVACEVFAERWTPLVLRDLLCGHRHFNELRRGLPLISRTLLARRLRELEAAGMIERVPKRGGRGFEYQPTRACEALMPILMQLGEWGRQWMYPEVSKEDLDPALLMWDVQQRLRTEMLPTSRTVVQFSFRGMPRRTRELGLWWLVIERPDVELCMKDPGYEVDLYVNADLLAMTRVWMGEQTMQSAVSSGLVQLHGPRRLVNDFPRWLMLSVFARPRDVDAGSSTSIRDERSFQDRSMSALHRR
ncbi:MAG: helix-turn-helix domain-containing protein [Burkholderiales bacterium]